MKDILDEKLVGNFYIRINPLRPEKTKDTPLIYVCLVDDGGQYLHSDGTLHTSTAKDYTNGIFPGYYHTVEEAEKAIELYHSLNF